MSHSSAADAINAADNIRSIEFYATQYENKSPELHCRIFKLPGLTKAEHEALAGELNAVVGPVIDRFAERLLSRAANQLRPYLADQQDNSRPA